MSASPPPGAHATRQTALKKLIRAAVALNLDGKSKPKPRRAGRKRADWRLPWW